MVIQIQFRYSQHTRLQQQERRIGQVGRLHGPEEKGALSGNVAKQKLQVKLDFTESDHAFPLSLSLWFCLLTQYVCKNPSKAMVMGDELRNEVVIFPLYHRLTRNYCVHLKKKNVNCQLLELLLWQYSLFFFLFF